jgi:hypothetical protein
MLFCRRNVLRINSIYLFTLFSLTNPFVWEKTVCVELKYLGDIFIFDSHLDKHFLENRFARKQFDGEKKQF